LRLRWLEVLGSRSPASLALVWWDEVAKPFFRDFCQRFSKMVAHRRREMRNFFQVALAAALEAEDWPRVRGCRVRMEELDQALLRGRRIRAGVAPAPGGLEDPLFLAAAEGKRDCDLEAIKLEDGSMTRDPALIEAEVTRYFEALFQGRHAVGSGCGLRQLCPI
jgi:hypothetical protein